VTLARRIAAVEASLTPTQLVLRWIDEAHGHGSIEGSAAALLDIEPRDVPLNRLCREAEYAVRRSVTTRDRREVNKAVAKALRETAFRLMLALRNNVVAHEELRSERLLQFGYPAHLALLAGASGKDMRDDSYRSWMLRALEILLGRVAHLDAIAEARRLAEERYFDGRPVLFPDVRATWDATVSESRDIAAMAVQLAELSDVALPDDADDESDRVSPLLADLVEHSKATALEKLGDGERGWRIATEWLRTKLDDSDDEDHVRVSDGPTL
jgi:hypothetical protein